MIYLYRRWRREFPTWERPVQISMVIALCLLLVMVVLFLGAPDDARQNVLIGIGALTLVTQIIWMYGNRGMVTPVGKAQRAYLRGDYAAVLEALEPQHAAGNADSTTVMLLGNAYRQLGRLDESLAVLSEAVDKYPNHHPSLYGFGRTLIIKGNFAEGADWIERALTAGAPPMLRFDLAEAYYLLGERERAQAALEATDTSEPQRALMSAYWRWRYANAPAPATTLIEAGIGYWQALTERFAETPYGLAVAQQVYELQALRKGEQSKWKQQQ
ncbi:MAG: tetratricopeptide repeat protein [Chloroflexota bacterium]|nr:tetratricopeptide repeat protein [Chloroflexota bacterium]